MKYTNVFSSTFIMVTAIFSTSVARANNNLTFPPANVLENVSQPIPTPAASKIVSSETVKQAQPEPYIFGKSNSKHNPQFIPSPKQAQKFVPSSVGANTSMPSSVPNNFTNTLPFENSKIRSLGNNTNNFHPFNKANMPFMDNSGGLMPSNLMTNMFGSNSGNNWNMPFTNSNNNRKKAWGNTRHIWPDFYTDFTDESWDTMLSTPRDMGRMPGGWRFPYISMPDPVTVSDAITNQFPPIAEEAANMADFSDWGVFDN